MKDLILKHCVNKIFNAPHKLDEKFDFKINLGIDNQRKRIYNISNFIGFNKIKKVDKKILGKSVLGRYSFYEDQIYILKNLNKALELYTLAHETIHLIRKHNPNEIDLLCAEIKTNIISVMVLCHFCKRHEPLFNLAKAAICSAYNNYATWQPFSLETLLRYASINKNVIFGTSQQLINIIQGDWRVRW